MKEHVVTIGPYKGGMSLFIDGAVRAFTSFKITETPDTQAMLKAARMEIPAMARQGINLCWIPVFLNWKGPDSYDFSDMDKRITTVLKLYDQHTPQDAQKAAIVVRIQAAVFQPRWYIDKFRDAAGKATNLIEFRNPWGKVDGYESTCAISPGDEFWDTYAPDCLRAIVEHVRKSAYAHRVFGWLPCAFNSNEWFLRTFAPEATCDFSKPTQAAFKTHLHKLKIACNNEPVPPPAACQKMGRGEFLDCAQNEGRRTEEFSLWLNQRIAGIILKFARLIKAQYADSPKLVGFFYGYTNELSTFQNLSQSGHLGLRKILDSADIDFICSPCQYRYRHDEGPFSYNLTLGPFANSGKCRNKLVFAEDDHPPVFVHSTNTDFATRDIWHDEMFFRRNFAQVWAHGQQMWWYSLGPQWFREKYRQKIVGDLHRIGLEGLEKDRSPAGEVAVVVDERSVSTMRLNSPFQQQLLLNSLAAFFPTGTPVECHELESFLRHADHSRFKVVAFLNLFLVDRKISAAVEKLKADNRTLIFSFAPGFLRGDPGQRVFSTEAAGKLAGMRLKEEQQAMPLTVWIDPERAPLFAEKGDIRYGWLNPEIVIKPVLGINDSKAQALGFLHSGTPGFGLKKHADWTAVFSAPPCIPSDVIQVLLKNAGVHLYTETNDIIYANRSMIAYVACSRGMKRINMPCSATLADALTGEELVLDSGNKCEIFMQRHETRIFWIKTGRKIK